MDAISVSSTTPRRYLNGTEPIDTQLNLNVPSYLYREIPTVFETIGVVLNITIIIYFIKSGKYKSPIFTILTSLAVADTCACLGGTMNMLYVPKVVIPEAGFLCMLGMFVAVTGILGSEYTMILFAGVRLYQVIAPLNARASATMSLMVKCCATILTASVGLSLFFAVFWHPVTTVVNEESITVCTFIADNYSKDMAILITFTVIPCSTIFIIHLLKYFAHARSKTLFRTNQERKSPDAHVAFILIFLFYICWVPTLTYQTIQHFKIDDYNAIVGDEVFLIMIHLVYANSIINPLVYVLAVKSIRDDVIKLFCFTKQAHSMQSPG